MSKEKLFDYVVRRNFQIAKSKTGYSFFGLFSALNDDGALNVARRFISEEFRYDFQDGLRELKRHGLLHLSVEQAIVAFGRRGFIFSDADIAAASERLRLARVLLH